MHLLGFGRLICIFRERYNNQTLNPLLFLLPLAFSNFLPFART
ncbi:hypothetical protein OIU76_005428 [Salix suchowensis]|nr:hypothetical protein OIU78_015305 [Salix suchowensis]KAJ6343681.1 hypothetical protein OIU76_005428 [Salix suchowensis]